MKRAIIYDRASTILQKDNWSRVDAEKVGIRIAEQHGYEWEYIQEIGSGTTLTGRPKMLAVLDRIAAGEVQVIIVQDLDRLARPTERAVYETIRNICLQNRVLIHTHTGVFNLADDDSDFVADINMAVAKKETLRIRKRMRRGMVAKAALGKYVGGQVGLGYKLVYQDDGSGKPKAALTIDETGAELVKLIFNIIEETGGNLTATTKEINRLGYLGKDGGRFRRNSIQIISQNRMYIGVFEVPKITDKISHRPDLQIISVNQFERVQELINSRRTGKVTAGIGRHLLTGFVVCGNCLGGVIAGGRDSRIIYHCVNCSTFGNSVCSTGKSYSQHLILPAIIKFLTGLIQDQIKFTSMLNDAAAQYGKTVSEEALEAAIHGELASVKAGKERIVEAISLGVLSTVEASTRLEDLREQERRLLAELTSISEKTNIKVEWLIAIDQLRSMDLEMALNDLAKNHPASFRRLLSLVFKPNSLRVHTERLPGSRNWRGVLVSYELTDAMEETLNIFTVSFNNLPFGR